MITECERVKAFQHTKDLASNLVNNEEGMLYYKILANFIAKSYPTKQIQLDESVLLNNSAMIGSLSELLQYAITVASEESSQKYYTTGQLSKFFGVSITSINNWINENRFIGIQRSSRNKQLRISENAIWRSPNGEHISIKDVVEMWEKQNLK